MEFYIDDLRLPVPVSEVKVKTGADIKTISLVGGNEISMHGGKKLDTLSFDSFFPSRYRNFCQYRDFPQPDSFISHIEGSRDSKTPIRFIITETDINKLFFVESFEKTYKINALGDVYFSISLTEYVPQDIPQIAPASSSSSIKKVVKTTNKRPSDKKKKSSTTHIVKSSDTLWGIAKKYYGDGNQYNKIYNANKKLIKNPNLIKDGWKLVIP